MGNGDGWRCLCGCCSIGDDGELGGDEAEIHQEKHKTYHTHANGHL